MLHDNGSSDRGAGATTAFPVASSCSSGVLRSSSSLCVIPAMVGGTRTHKKGKPAVNTWFRTSDDFVNGVMME